MVFYKHYKGRVICNKRKLAKRAQKLSSLWKAYLKNANVLSKHIDILDTLSLCYVFGLISKLVWFENKKINIGNIQHHNFDW